MTVPATGDGFEALRWLEDETFDLLVVDVEDAEIDGPTLYREVQDRGAGRSITPACSWSPDSANRLPRARAAGGARRAPPLQAVLARRPQGRDGARC